MRFDYRPRDDWPPLAWLARLQADGGAIVVEHGGAVETTPRWFCEAAWAGEFAAGDFDLTDVVTGSGVRLRDDGATFVSSGSTVDRLQSLTAGDRLWVSNSLPCLLAAAGATLEPSYRYYLNDLLSIVRGLNRYRQTLNCSAGEVRLTYFNNLHWDGAGLRLSEREKPHADRSFADFAAYRRFLDDSLGALVDNLRDPRRRTDYRLLGTLSTGYDSTFATALLKPLGLEEVLCFSRPGGRDDGAAIASRFGVRARIVELDRWREFPLAEVPFIAADGFGEEVHYRGAESLLSRRLLVTGFHGDKVWDKNVSYRGRDLVRGDLSGTSLTEYRLWAGFFHCALPFFGARQVADLVRISNSDELRPWDIGGDYSRPICRRVVEQAGVPRDAFGRQKSYASRWFIADVDFLAAGSARHFLDWLRARRGRWLRRGRLPPLRSRALDRLRMGALRGVGTVIGKTPGFYRLRLHRFGPLRFVTELDMNNTDRPPPLLGFRRYTFPWAVEQAQERYRRGAAEVSSAADRSTI